MTVVRNVLVDGLDKSIQIRELSAAERRLMKRSRPRNGEPPYWSVLWPGGVALAGYLAENYAGCGLNGKNVLDLGCGLGLTGIVCATMGANVTFLDSVPEALAMVEQNSRLNGIFMYRTVVGRWGRVRSLLDMRCDVVVGGDVLYAKKEWRRIYQALVRVLRRGGKAVFAESRRLNDPDLIAVLAKGPLRLSKAERRIRWPPWRDQSKIIGPVTLYEFEYLE